MTNKTEFKCPIIPLSDKVVILPREEEEQMYGNIIVPDTGNEKPEIGEVMAVGPGRYNPNFEKTVPCTIKVGDMVIVPQFGAKTVILENEKYIISSEHDILGIVKKNKK